MSFLNKIHKYSISGTLLSHSIKKLNYAFAMLVRRIAYSHGKIDTNKLFVMTYDDCYACNPQYIVDEIIRQQLPIDIVWVTSKKARWTDSPLKSAQLNAEALKCLKNKQQQKFG